MRQLYVWTAAAGVSFGASGWAQTAQLPVTQPEPRAQVSAADAQQAVELMYEGWKFWRQQQYAQAVHHFQQAIELDPNTANAWNGLGWSQFNSGEPQPAKVSFEKAVELEHNHQAALNGLGQLYLTQGKYDEAERYLLKADHAPAAWHGLGRLYLVREKFEDAEKYLKKIADSEPAMRGDDEMLQRLLQAARDKKLDDELRVMLAPPTATEASQDVQRAFTLMQKGQMAEARELFERALEAAPDDPQVTNGVGWYRLNTGEIAEAQRLFEKTLEIQPNNGGATNGLANCYKRQGRVDEAIELWKKMYEQVPHSAGAWGLASTYNERGEFDKALPIWEKMAEQMPENEAVQAGLEQAREGAGKPEKKK